MALIECPECRKQVSDQAVACPHCGMPLKASEEPRHGKQPSAEAKVPRPSRAPAAPTTPGPVRKGFGSGFGGCLGVAVAIAIVIAILAAIGGALSNDDEPSSRNRVTLRAPVEPAAPPPSVIYRVSGTASRASLTYENDSGGTVQETVSVPWSKTLTGFDSDLDFLYVSAQNEGETGTLNCTISIGGRVVFKGDASGAYAICTASGTYGDR